MPPEVDLTVPRSTIELLTAAIELFVRHTALFLSVTLLIVAPVVIAVDGVWAGALRDGPDYELGFAASNVSLLLYAFVTPALVTALHAVIVRDLGEGRAVTVGASLREAAPALPLAFAVVALSTVGVALGLLALVVPGIWLVVRWYLGAQAAVLERRRPLDALRRSAELVSGRWWDTFGALLLSGLAFGIAGFTLGQLVGMVFTALDAPVLFVAAMTVVQAVTVSLGALFGTLLWFSRCAARLVSAAADDAAADDAGNGAGAVAVRFATVADAAAIAAVHVRAWHRGYPGLLPAALLAAITPTAARAAVARPPQRRRRRAGRDAGRRRPGRGRRPGRRRLLLLLDAEPRPRRDARDGGAGCALRRPAALGRRRRRHAGGGAAGAARRRCSPLARADAVDARRQRPRRRLLRPSRLRARRRAAHRHAQRPRRPPRRRPARAPAPHG